MATTTARTIGALLVAVSIAFALGAPPTAGAEVRSPTATMVAAQDPPRPEETIKSPTALPQPNSGKEAEYQGDRGTATQYFVMAGIIGSIVLIGLLIRRESRSKLDAQTASATEQTASATEQTASGVSET